MNIAEKFIQAITQTYGYHGATWWNTNKIKDILTSIDKGAAKKLDYTNAKTLALSIHKELETDITPYIVKYMYPVWVPPFNDVEPNPKNKNLLITVRNSDCNLNRYYELSKEYNLDFVVLDGRTQGFIGQEIFRIQRFVEAYDRTLYIHPDVGFENKIGRLFDIVPKDNLGVFIDEISVQAPYYLKQRLRILKSDAVRKNILLEEMVVDALSLENDILPCFNIKVMLLNKSDHTIFNPIEFVFEQKMYNEKAWIEIQAARNGVQLYLMKLDKELSKAKDVNNKSKFVTNTDFTQNTLNALKILPDIKAVIGNPRSGMFPASIIANHKSIPLLSMSNQIKEDVAKLNIKDKNLPILFVDDTVCSGTSIDKIKRFMLNEIPEEKILYFANYCTPNNVHKLDIYGDILPIPHILEWNLFNSTMMKICLLDIDGLLCPDVPLPLDDDGDKYVQYISNVKPIVNNLPRLFSCVGLCTGRISKYRDITQEWLHKYAIKYDRLFMFDGSKQERDTNHAENVGAFKVSKIKKTGAKIFIESCDYQSKVIARLLTEQGIDCIVLCINSGKVYS